MTAPARTASALGAALLVLLATNLLPFHGTSVLLANTVAVVLIAACFLLLREAGRRQRAVDDLRRKEVLYRRVLGRLPDAAVVLFDHDLRYLLADGGALGGVGLSREGLEGRTVWEALPTLAAQLEPMYRAALAGEEHVFDVAYGGRLYVTRAVPLRGPDDVVLAGMVLAIDVTEARRGEEEIRRLNTVLEQGLAELRVANEELEAFSYSVSHDLRAPLRHISGFVDLLRRGSQDRLDEDGRRHLDTIAHGAHTMGLLIDDLLAFSRASRAEPRRVPVDLGALAREVVKALGDPKAAGPAIEWVIGELPLVDGDPALLRIALTNLVDNAVKYSRGRDPARVEIGQGPAVDGQAVVFVRDNGVGFDMREAGRLFGAFQRLHPADEFEGTGIGLATVRRIVHRHGGRTWAEGQPGGGATFYLALPRAGQGPWPGADPGGSADPAGGL